MEACNEVRDPLRCKRVQCRDEASPCTVEVYGVDELREKNTAPLVTFHLEAALRCGVVSSQRAVSIETEARAAYSRASQLPRT